MGYLIVTLDGGGVRGVYTARLLERLQEAAPFLHLVRFFAGTSIGGINAAYLAKNQSVDGLVDLFLMHARKIFRSRDFMDRIAPDELVRANYDQTGLREVLLEVFRPDETFRDFKAKCMVVTFDLDNEAPKGQLRTWKPKYGHSWDDNDCKVPVIDWLLRTSAAPTYFPSYQGFVDGGVVDNNPCAAAMAKAVKEGYGAGREDLVARLLGHLTMEQARSKVFSPHVAAAVQELKTTRQKQIKVLSLGTGLNPHRISGDKHDWGYKQWLDDNRLLDMLFEGMLGPPEYICSQMLGESFHRLAPALTDPVDLDEVKRVDDLVAMADEVDIGPTVTWLKHHLGVGSA